MEAPFLLLSPRAFFGVSFLMFALLSVRMADGDSGPPDITTISHRQNPYVERLIGTVRRDCLDHVLIFGERHLRRVLTLYSLYYNETRTHVGLCKNAPRRRAVQRSGII